MSSPFVARNGSIEVRLGPEDRHLLGQVPDLLASVGAEPDDPAYPVLHRDAHPDDAEATARFDELVAGERSAGRRIDRGVVETVADGAQTLSRMEGLSLLRSLNEARLALAARRGAFEEDSSWERQAATDPALAAVAWMSSLQVSLIRAIDRLG
jgi:hypothetical protein